MIEAKEEPLPNSAFDYSDRVNETARMITDKKRKDGAWICGCVKAPKLWIDDVSFSNSLTVGHNGSVHSFSHICFEGVVSESGEVERVSRERRRARRLSALLLSLGGYRTMYGSLIRHDPAHGKEARSVK